MSNMTAKQEIILRIAIESTRTLFDNKPSIPTGTSIDEAFRARVFKNMDELSKDKNFIAFIEKIK